MPDYSMIDKYPNDVSKGEVGITSIKRVSKDKEYKKIPYSDRKPMIKKIIPKDYKMKTYLPGTTDTKKQMG